MREFFRGLRKGLPIAVGYLSVSFTFGVKATNGGIPAWIAVLMSFTNLTSAGQFAGATLIIAQASYLELAVATFVINIRYLLMSLALSQKLKKGTKLLQRMVVGFGITDEIFAVASTEPAEISARYMYGLISLRLRLDAGNTFRSTGFPRNAGSFVKCDGVGAIRYVYCDYCSTGAQKPCHCACYTTSCRGCVRDARNTNIKSDFNGLSGDSRCGTGSSSRGSSKTG